MAMSLGYVIYYVPVVSRTVAFYADAFGLRTRLVTPEGDYGELETGATTLAFASEDLAQTNLGASGGFTRLGSVDRPVGASITLVTNDVGAATDAAAAAGARVRVPPTDKPWGQTVAYVVDPDGILVELATPVNPEGPAG